MLAAPEVTTTVRLLRLVIFVVGVAASSATAAPGVQLSIESGRVWLVTSGATVGQILAEWARVGGTRVINGDRVADGPLTLEMRGVPELQALEVVMRSTGGFIAAARTPGAATLPPNLSRFDRIVVLPPAAARPADRSIRAEAASSPERPPRALAPPVSNFSASGGHRIIGPDGQPVPDDQEGAPPPPPPSPSPLRPPRLD